MTIVKISKEVNFMGNVRHKNKKKKESLPFIIVREEAVDRNAIYGKNFFSKIKTVLLYMDDKSGRSRRRKELEERRKNDALARLQVTCSKYFDFIYKQLVPVHGQRSNVKAVTSQLDVKFQTVLDTIIHNRRADMNIAIKPVNKNYRKYTNKIPIVVESECKTSQI